MHSPPDSFEDTYFERLSTNDFPLCHSNMCFTQTINFDVFDLKAEEKNDFKKMEEKKIALPFT